MAARLFVLTMIVGRVAVVTAVWIVVYLVTFTGYLTLPAIFLGALLLAYAAFSFLRARQSPRTRAVSVLDPRPAGD